MKCRIPDVRSLASSARYLGILTALVAVGWIGHKTHWTFHLSALIANDQPLNVPGSGSADPVTARKVGTAVEPWSIKFPSKRSLELSEIETAAIEQKSISERVQTTGVITYDERHSASLSARATGTVWQVPKRVGETIRRDDVLAIVDSADVGQFKAEFLSSLVATEAKAEILSNLESVAGGAIPQRQVREARVALREARIRMLNAEQTLHNLGFNLRSEDFQNLSDEERALKIRFLGLPDSIIRELGPDRASSNLMPIRATFDGIILRQDVALGEIAEAGKPILEIADIRRMWLKLDVPKEDASKLSLGQQVTFYPDGIGNELRTAIDWISTEMNEQTRTLQVRAEVANPVVASDASSGQEVRLLRANTFGTGTITLRKSAAALVVPVSAVLYDNDQPLVFVRTGELSFERVDVQVGIRDRREVQVYATTLQPEAEVVAHGGHILKSEWMLNHVAASSP